MFLRCFYQNKKEYQKKTLVLDLDETLVHSSFSIIEDATFIFPIQVDLKTCNVFVKVRPGAQFFIEEVSKYYEIIIYTASISRYAEPLLK